MQEHLVIVKSGYLQAILNGQKTIEMRTSLYSLRAYLNIKKGDRLWFKAVGGDVQCYANVLWIKRLHIRSVRQAIAVRSRWNKKIKANWQFWKAGLKKPNWTLIGFGGIHKCKPFSLTKKDGRGWVVLSRHCSWWPAPPAFSTHQSQKSLLT